MIIREHLLSIVKTLTSKEKRKTCVALLDDLFEFAKTLSEFEALGEAALELKYAEMYLRCAEICYALSRTSQQIKASRENLYKAYNLNNLPEKALFYIDLALKDDPTNEELLSNKAFNLSLSNKKEEAEAILEELMARSTKSNSLEFTLCGKYLRTGQTKRGIDLFINTFKKENELFKGLGLKFWTGGIYPGKTLVINGEGGIGDELINIRFLHTIKDLGMHPILYSSWHMYRPDTVSLFKRHGFEVTTNSFFFKKDWLWTHMMSLPGFLGLTEQDLWKGPYLFPLRQEKNKLPSTDKIRIGIKVSGNPHFEQDVYRRIPIEPFLEALPKQAEIYYIDTDKEYAGTISLKARISTWEDTLDFIDQMDIIVSSCTSLVHAAGAMGKRTIVIVPIAEYYIWTSTRTNNSTPWYGDNLTVLRQTKLRSWKEPLAQMSEMVHKLV